MRIYFNHIKNLQGGFPRKPPYSAMFHTITKNYKAIEKKSIVFGNGDK
jgi:hypothetical protein